MWEVCKKFIKDQITDSTGAYCGARIMIIMGGLEIMVQFALGHATASDVYGGLSALAVAYAGKDWSERR
jgi:hypothetical protein